ncbi:hypothetical protein P43SY_010260 [Pythium insidiosum]|uniref:Uncharacterized protein n=1 Tax=Pythium insidiosum TaxID=114742 RepID=A0AAD5LPC5_PYTIN|nr:hypothetical protein P43SY_010260 [Pythium insidiosum]
MSFGSLSTASSGIKESVRAVTDELISIPISGDNDKNKFIKFWSFCTPSFRNIRLTYGISDAEYINMFGATTKVGDITMQIL